MINGSNYSNGTQLNMNAKATDYNGNVAWSNSLYQTVQDNGSGSGSGNVWVSNWLDNTNSTLSRSATNVLHVQASANQGLQRIEVYINGSVQRTCNYSQVYGNQNCDVTIYGSNYSNGSQLAMNAKATDYNGNVAWSDLKYLTIQDNGGSSGSGNVNVWVANWLDNSNATMNRSSSNVLRVQANSSQGLSRVEVYVNGSIQRTCNYSQSYGNQNCDLNIYGSNYSNGTQLAMNAKATDYSGNVGWSDLKYLTIQDNGQTTNNGDSPAISAWSEPDASQITTAGQTVYHVSASDADGLNRIEMWVNGMKAQTCSLGTAYGSQTCQVTIQGSSYKYGDQIYVNAKAVDSYGRETWSSAKTYNVVQATTNGSLQSNSQGAISAQSTADSGYGANDTITFSATGSDGDGIQRIELYVNSALAKTCYGQTSCSWSGEPYGTRNSVTYAARLYDNKGYSVSTGYKTIYKK